MRYVLLAVWMRLAFGVRNGFYVWAMRCGSPPAARRASQLWSLADIHEANGNLVSKNAAFDKQYLSGRYGADPYLTRIEEWD